VGIKEKFSVCTYNLLHLFDYTMSTIALSIFTPTDAYKADPSVMNEGMELVNSIDGVLECLILYLALCREG
jgi:hypothetical protein